jgi:hypothetical protein
MQNEHITSPTAAIKIILGGSNPASFKTKEVLAQLAEQFPHIETHYRFVFGTLARLAKSYSKGATDEVGIVASSVLDYANEHYANGWDVIVETMTHGEIKAELAEEGITTFQKAIAHFGELVKVRGEQERAVIAEVF